MEETGATFPHSLVMRAEHLQGIAMDKAAVKRDAAHGARY